MLLLRHNSLAPPFHDYETLSPEQLAGLADGTISPSIAALPDSLPWTSEIADKVSTAKRFVCSTSRRTQETCRATVNRLGIGQDFLIDPCLDEISFSPRHLAEDGLSPLAAVRKNLYPAILTGAPEHESAEALSRRMNVILETYGAEDVLFSHGFFMRLLSAYAAQDKDMNKTLAAIACTPAIPYLGALAL